MITVVFKSPPPDIHVTLNGRVAQYESTSDCSIRINVEFGFHKLEITNLTDARVEVENVLLGNSNSRKLLYLSWSTDLDHTRYQPCTALWQKGMTWTLPFIFPMSNWITCVDQKFKNGVFGTNLFDDHVCYYPESLVIGHPNIPTIVKDFYQSNFDFTVILKDRSDPTCIPFMKYAREIPDNLVDDIRTEIYANRHLIQGNTEKPPSADSNLSEFNINDSDAWKPYWLHRINAQDMSASVARLDTFPKVQQLIDYLQLDVFHCFIGLLQPGQFIYPHIDDCSRPYQHNYEKYQGCTQLYIPIDWPAGSSLKFGNAGIVPLDNGPMVINTDYFTHSAINTSDQDRFILAIRTTQEILADCTFDYK